MIPHGSRLSLLAKLPTMVLRRAALKMFLSPSSPHFAARSDGASAEAHFRQRIKSYSRDTLVALLAVAKSDPTFQYNVRIAPLSEYVLRDVCAVHDMLGTIHAMSFARRIEDTFNVINRLNVGFPPGKLITADEETVTLVRSLICLIDVDYNGATTVHPSVIELLRVEPDSWREVRDFAHTHNTSIENVHADQIREARILGTSAFQGGIL